MFIAYRFSYVSIGQFPIHFPKARNRCLNIIFLYMKC